MMSVTAVILAAALLLPLAAQAQASVNGVEVRPGARVDVVFYTADDCGYCNRWKAESKADALKWAAQAKFGFHEIGKVRIKDPYRAHNFPAAAAFAWEQLKTEGRYNFLIPRWTVFADGRKVFDGRGIGNWGSVSAFAKEALDARDAPRK